MPIPGLEQPNLNNILEKQLRKNLNFMFSQQGMEGADKAREQQLELQGPVIGPAQNPFLTWLKRTKRNIDTGLSHIKEGVVEGFTSPSSPVKIPKPLASLISDIFIPGSLEEVGLNLAMSGIPASKAPQKVIDWAFDDEATLGTQIWENVSKLGSSLKKMNWPEEDIEEVVGNTAIDAYTYLRNSDTTPTKEGFTQALHDFFVKAATAVRRRRRMEGEQIDIEQFEKGLNPEVSPIQVGSEEGVLQVTSRESPPTTTETYRSEQDLSKLQELVNQIQDPWAKGVALTSLNLPKDTVYRQTVPTVKKGGIIEMVKVKTPGAREIARRLDIPKSTVSDRMERVVNILSPQSGGENIFTSLKSARSFINDRFSDNERQYILEEIAKRQFGRPRGTPLSQALQYLKGKSPSDIKSFNAEEVLKILNDYILEVGKYRSRRGGPKPPLLRSK